ncbi:MAG: tyrosine-type recombinase/integrase [Candidatus Acidiferrales bacterium]
MAQSKFTLYKFVKLDNGDWRYKKAAFYSNGKIKPNRCLVDGKEEEHLEGAYYLNHKNHWIPVGSDALDAQRKRNAQLDYEEFKRLRGTAAAVPAPNVVPIMPRRTLADAVEEFCNETEANKKYRTYLAYKKSTEYFLQSCSKPTAEGVDRKDMLHFKIFLKGEGFSKRYVYNNFLNVMIFLKWAKVEHGVQKGDWPPKPERDPEEYADEEIEMLLHEADDEERLLLSSFLCSGFRSGELANFTHADINFATNIWRVEMKEDGESAEWDAKTQSSYRYVTVPAWLNQKIERQMKARCAKRTDLVFPAPMGGVNCHLLRILKRVAKRAGLTEIRVDDHKFRSTAITRWLREGVSPQDVMAWVGHKSLATILRYAAKIKLEKTETQQKAHSPFAKFANVGGEIPKPKIIKTGTDGD